MNTIAKFCALFTVSVIGFLVCLGLILEPVSPGNVGVRLSNISGITQEDLSPGWNREILFVENITELPSTYMTLNYDGNNSFEVRTTDNNRVWVDVSIPYRIRTGEAHNIMEAGNHIEDGNGGWKFQRLMHRFADDVLREELGKLASADFYDTNRRLEVGDATTKALNNQLAEINLEAKEVLMRATYFRKEYEGQLTRIQLNEQGKMLNAAQKVVADNQQTLDNYNKHTGALQQAAEQDWATKMAELVRAYQVGFVNTEHQVPGAARKALEQLSEGDRTELIARAAEVLGAKVEDITDDHLLGIKNIHAETAEYSQRVTAESAGQSSKLKAQGDAKVAEVQGAFDAKKNALLNSSAGRAFVAYEAADNVKFDDNLSFQSRDGIPPVLQLRKFAEQFMGK